ncbi:hypothetical protein KUL72_03925 [Bradyrhizobium arachidis]|uniref:hypothetical protein n=1 Tax=Bradyrhizobium TaxID=374 RepID=UPI002161560B|nr:MULTISPECIES: hypothetical protein [Bradyrhizobium]MDN4987037.1 hypothetical protein [Bradyrhizobium sp. WYCCWR 13022]UVO37551.1 hypothetical protein KUL72_03925 [Bradyrhizobium arachidis]
MHLLHLVSYFWGGAFLANAIPHLVSGQRGEPFQTPFATPRGEGLSSSTINVLWGSLNVIVAYLLVCRVGEFALLNTEDVVAFGLGAMLLSLFLARRFGQFHGGNSPAGS